LTPRQTTAFTVLAVIVVVLGASHGVWQWGHRGKRLQFTEQELQWIREHNGRVSVGADPDYPPVDFVDAQGHQRGVAEDILTLVEERSGLHFNRINFSTWSDELSAAESRNLDVMKAVAQTTERSKYLYFTQSFINIPTFFISKDPELRIFDDGALKGKRVAISQGYASFDYVSKHYSDVSIVPVNNDAEALISASTGAVDLAVSDLPTASYLIHDRRLSNLHVLGETGLIFKMSLATRSDWPLLNSILTKTVDSITAEEREEIIGKWINLDERGKLFPRRFWVGVSVFAVSISLLWLVVRAWNYSLLSIVRKRTEELRAHQANLETVVRERTEELVGANEKLSSALANIKTLTGILPICAGCKKIRNDVGYWEQVDSYIKKHTDVDFSHGICPECLARLYPEFADSKPNASAKGPADSP
jgi:ABC-type amino acid transport substrate-binding protein